MLGIFTVLLRIQDFWDAALYRWMRGSKISIQSAAVTFKAQIPVFLGLLDP
jgi:hypothetical protein